MLKCSCGLFYIGECEDFRARVNLHTNQIKQKNRNLYVSKHIYQCGGKFSAAPIKLLSSNDMTIRKVTEDALIDKFKPELNR